MHHEPVGASANRPRTFDSLGARVAAIIAIVAGTTATIGQPSDESGMNSGSTSSGPWSSGPIQPPSEEDVNRLKDDVKVDSNDLVELHVRDEDLQTVLQMLSIQGSRSIVATQNVSGTVTANLYGVTFQEALEAILIYNGFGYIEQNGVLYVMPLEQINQVVQSQRKRESRIIKLDYLNAVDAAQFAQPLLSEGATIVTNGVTQEFNIPSDSPVGKDDFALESTLLVYDYAENIDEITHLLDNLDTRPQSVLVEATILQSAITEANAFGIDFAIIADMDFVDFTPLGGPLQAVNGLITGGGGSGGGGGDDDDDDSGGGSSIPDDGKGRGIVANPGNTAGPATFKAGIVHNDVAAFIRLLDQVGDTTIISNPKILTLNRQPARVQVGRRVGYLSSTTTDTSTQQTVEFLDTGTQLYVRPFCSTDGYIRMELRPEVSQPIIRQVTDTGGQTVTVPDEDTSHIVTNVMVRDGQTVVLGGLFTERTVANRRQVPVVGDLPLIGPAFRGHDDSIDRAEIVFVVTPTRMNDQVLTEQGQEAMRYATNMRAGAREGLLPWSREKRSSQLLVEAERLAAHGDIQGALNRVTRSLALKSSSPDAIKLRERLLSNPTVWPTRSMMEDIINHEAQRRAEILAQYKPDPITNPGPFDPSTLPTTTFTPPVESRNDAFTSAEPQASATPSSTNTSTDTSRFSGIVEYVPPIAGGSFTSAQDSDFMDTDWPFDGSTGTVWDDEPWSFEGAFQSTYEDRPFANGSDFSTQAEFSKSTPSLWDMQASFQSLMSTIWSTQNLANVDEEN